MSDQSIHVVQAVSNVPFTLSTQSQWERSRVIGAIIINRLSLNGTINDLSAGAFRMLVAMADIFGVARENCAGLIIKADGIRTQLSKSVGLAERSNYKPIRELELLGIVRRGRPGGPYGDDFELIMPAEPLYGSPEQAERESLDCEASQSSDSGGGFFTLTG